ncbi:MAG: hypothetical protein DMF69_06910 [Acidobacteria bacterium]|nr:MAG: hypothetical protein DMF69_06910 [Acidobacteriota bacterium]
MSNKIRARVEGLAVPAVIHTANLPQDTALKITGDATVDKSTTVDDKIVGELRVPSRTADGQGTVETRFRALVDAECDGAIAAGDYIKAGDHNSGVQCFKKWTPLGVSAGPVFTGDLPHLIVGQCWVGGADTETGTFLLF